MEGVRRRDLGNDGFDAVEWIARNYLNPVMAELEAAQSAVQYGS